MANDTMERLSGTVSPFEPIRIRLTTRSPEEELASGIRTRRTILSEPSILIQDACSSQAGSYAFWILRITLPTANLFSLFYGNS